MGAKSVYKLRIDPVGLVTRPKSRLVASILSQILSIRHDETFLPIPSTSSIGPIVATALENDLKYFNLNAERMFVQSRLELGNDHACYFPGCGE